jgi:hypothetical protein
MLARRQDIVSGLAGRAWSRLLASYGHLIDLPNGDTEPGRHIGGRSAARAGFRSGDGIHFAREHGDCSHTLLTTAAMRFSLHRCTPHSTGHDQDR